LVALEKAPAATIDAILAGLEANWNDDKKFPLTPAIEASLEKLLGLASPSSSSSIIILANRWGSQKLAKYGQEIAAKLLATVTAEGSDERQRTDAAKRAIEFQPESDAVVDALLAAVNPRLSPEAARGILSALRGSRAAGLGTKIVDRLPSFSPAAKREALTLLLAKPALTNAFLSAVEGGKASLNDLALDQRQSLAAHPDKAVMERAKKLMASGGSLPSADRKKVLEDFAHIAHKKGDVTMGKEVYKQQCSKCHIHSGEGVAIGPDLTGMAVHPKEELLVHILDPSRSVESNFRAYTLLTVDGLVLTGMLASESKTAVELFDTEGKKQAVLREDIEQLTASPKSIMPEGFEKSVNEQQLTDLLEFLTARGRYVPLDIAKAATSATDRGMFLEREGSETMMFRDWSPKVFNGVPFHVVAPRDGNVLNAIQLYGPNGDMSKKMPKSVSLACSGSVKTLHILGGVAGWGSPYGKPNEVSMIVRLTYADGQTEDHKLLNGVHIADYIRRVDVPKSEFAFDLRGKQLRYLAINPERKESITKIDIVKGDGESSPVVMALTIESP
jgi:putative heme-binding domain-containing protein